MSTPSTPRINSFILRIWWEELDPDPGGRRLWRGWVQHVRSGEAIYFQDLGKLLAFLQRWTGELVSSNSTHRP